MAHKPNLGWECPCCKKTWSPSTTGCMACNYPWEKSVPDLTSKPKSEETNNQDGKLLNIQCKACEYRTKIENVPSSRLDAFVFVCERCSLAVKLWLSHDEDEFTRTEDGLKV